MVERFRKSDIPAKNYAYPPNEVLQVLETVNPWFSNTIDDAYRSSVRSLISNQVEEGRSADEIVKKMLQPEENIDFDQFAWIIKSDHEALRGADESLIRYGPWALAGRELLEKEEALKQIETGVIFQSIPDLEIYPIVLKNMKEHIRGYKQLREFLYEEVSEEGFRITISQRK